MEGHTAAESRIILSDLGLPTPPTPDASFASNGLVVPITGGVVIRTGAANTFSLVTLSCVDAEPNTLHEKWEDVVEVSFSATGGLRLAPITTLWLPDPGDYRARVHALRRDAGVDDGAHAGEEYEIVVWPAPPAPERIVKATDRLGHRLRGEPEQDSVERPELAFRPIYEHFEVAATVTVTIGATFDEVVRAFGANPIPQPSNDPYDGMLRPVEIPSRASERPGILVIEPDHYRGSDKSVLEELSRHGRAASMYWNVNAVTTLSIAENGELLDAFEGWDEATHPAVRALVEGLDIHDYHDKVARGLVVIERFTGCTVTEDLVSQIEAMTVGYRLSW
jgi:hypothetical protein